MSQCKSCNARIEWIETPTGRKHPIDATSIKVWINHGAWTLIEAHQSHFDTCPDAEKWREKKKQEAMEKSKQRRLF